MSRKQEAGREALALAAWKSERAAKRAARRESAARTEHRVPALALGDSLEAFGLALLSESDGALEALERMGASTGERMALSYGQRAADCTSEAFRYAAWQYGWARSAGTEVTGDGAEDWLARLLKRSVRDGARAVIRQVRESAPQSAPREAPAFADWTDDAILSRAERYTAGRLAERRRDGTAIVTDTAVRNASAVLAARALYAFPRVGPAPRTGGTNGADGLRSAEQSAESAWLRLVDSEALRLAFTAAFGAETTEALASVTREARHAKRADKATGRKRGDLLRAPRVGWSDYAEALAIDRGTARREALESVALVGALRTFRGRCFGTSVSAEVQSIAERLALAPRGPRPVAKTAATSVTEAPSTEAERAALADWRGAGGLAAVLTWSPTDAQSERAKRRAAKREKRQRAAFLHLLRNVTPRRETNAYAWDGSRFGHGEALRSEAERAAVNASASRSARQVRAAERFGR